MPEYANDAAGKEARHFMLMDIQARESKLDDWSRTFIDDIMHTIEAGGNLTDKQAEKFEEIWDNVTL